MNPQGEYLEKQENDPKDQFYWIRLARLIEMMKKCWV